MRLRYGPLSAGQGSWARADADLGFLVVCHAAAGYEGMSEQILGSGGGPASCLTDEGGLLFMLPEIRAGTAPRS